jgi:alkylhydroperoxidase family enzyme
MRRAWSRITIFWTNKMAYIKTIGIEVAEGIVKQEYEKGIRRSGRVYNIIKIMSRSPESLKDAMKMYLTIMYGPSDLSRAQREMLATVISRANHCHY